MMGVAFDRSQAATRSSTTSSIATVRTQQKGASNNVNGTVTIVQVGINAQENYSPTQSDTVRQKSDKSPTQSDQSDTVRHKQKQKQRQINQKQG